MLIKKRVFPKELQAEIHRFYLCDSLITATTLSFHLLKPIQFILDSYSAQEFPEQHDHLLFPLYAGLHTVWL